MKITIITQLIIIVIILKKNNTVFILFFDTNTIVVQLILPIPPRQVKSYVPIRGTFHRLRIDIFALSVKNKLSDLK
jgi:hypothetical protein